MANIDITFPEGVRAVLVSQDDANGLHTQPVYFGESVLNLEKDLISHLNEYPFSDEWLAELRGYIDARLEARKTARKSGSLSIPHKHKWRVANGLPKA